MIRFLLWVPACTKAHTDLINQQQINLINPNTDLINQQNSSMSFWDQVVATTETLADKAKEGAIQVCSIHTWLHACLFFDESIPIQAKLVADVQLEKAKQSEAWAKTKEVAADLGQKTNAQLEKAKESDAWARTKEVA